MINFIKINLFSIIIFTFVIKDFVPPTYDLYINETNVNKFFNVYYSMFIYIVLLLTYYLYWLTYSYLNRVKVLSGSNIHYIKSTAYLPIGTMGEFKLRFSYITYQYLCLILILSITQSYTNILLFSLSVLITVALMTMLLYVIIVHITCMLYVYLRHRHLK